MDNKNREEKVLRQFPQTRYKVIFPDKACKYQRLLIKQSWL